MADQCQAHHLAYYQQKEFAEKSALSSHLNLIYPVFFGALLSKQQVWQAAVFLLWIQLASNYTSLNSRRKFFVEIIEIGYTKMGASPHVHLYRMFSI